MHHIDPQSLSRLHSLKGTNRKEEIKLSTAKRIIDPKDGFDVIVEMTIGRVEFDPYGDRSPVQAAFDLIAQDLCNTHDGGGRFKFTVNDRTYDVDVNVYAD